MISKNLTINKHFPFHSTNPSTDKSALEGQWSCLRKAVAGPQARHWCSVSVSVHNGRAHSADPDNDEEDVGAGNGAPTMTTPLLSLFAIIRLVYLLLKRKYIYQNIDFPFSWAEYQIFWFMASACRQLGSDFSLASLNQKIAKHWIILITFNKQFIYKCNFFRRQVQKNLLFIKKS